MQKGIYIVTGASRGVGEALCRSVLQRGHHVFACARSANPELECFATTTLGELSYRSLDLGNYAESRKFMDAVIRHARGAGPPTICLINNAAQLSPVGPAETLDPQEVAAHILTNLAGPMYLTSSLLSAVSELRLNSRVTVVNITSGAGKSPYFGRSVYCAGKAGLDMFTRTVAREQADRNLPNRVFAVRPGVIDTSMQTLSRNLPNEATHDRELFLRLKRDGKLLPTDTAAELILRTLDDPRVESGDIVDVRELYPDDVAL